MKDLLTVPFPHLHRNQYQHPNPSRKQARRYALVLKTDSVSLGTHEGAGKNSHSGDKKRELHGRERVVGLRLARARLWRAPKYCLADEKSEEGGQRSTRSTPRTRALYISSPFQGPRELADTHLFSACAPPTVPMYDARGVKRTASLDRTASAICCVAMRYRRVEKRRRTAEAVVTTDATCVSDRAV